MRHVYSIVRFVPNPANGECVNLGLIAGSENSAEWVLRTISRQSRASHLGDTDSLRGVMAYLRRLGTELNVYSTTYARGGIAVPANQERLDERWLAELASQQRGIVQFTAPTPVDVDSAEAAVDLLWDHLIVEPSPRSYRRQTKKVALRAVRSAFRGVPIHGRNVLETTRLDSEGFSAPIDFAVHNGSMAYLTQCWSFQLRDKERLLDSVQSWSWAIRALRSSGGSLTSETGIELQVANDVGLAVVYVPPAGPEDQDAFDKAQGAFSDRDVAASLVVGVERASEVADEASAALSLHLGTTSPESRLRRR